MGAGTAHDKAEWRRFRSEIPDVHLREIEGRKMIPPALEYGKKHNAENGELYPAFPFRCFGLAFGTEDIVDWTMRHRSNKDRFDHKCWTQDQIHWAYAGNAAEAQDGLIHRYRHASRRCRFPLYGSEGPDSCPDFDHFGSGSTALQRMLVQEGTGSPSPHGSAAPGKIHLLPAWPSTWDVDFKFHLERRTVITGTVKDGVLLKWDVQPASRRKDVVVHEPQLIKQPDMIPGNTHPLRIGLDQKGQSKFRGEIGRVTLFRGVLKPSEVEALTQGDRARPVETGNVIRCVVAPKAGDQVPVNQKDLATDVSFGFWIKPVAGESARILDKVTPGVDDGLLIDTWPGLSVRVLVGPRPTTHSNVLKANVWQHVAVAIGPAGTDVYVNGTRQ